MSWVLIAMLAVPLAGAAVLVLMEPSRRLLRWHALAVSGVTLILAIVLAARFDYGAGQRIQAQTDWRWISGLDLRFHVGVDGISLPLIVLSALLSFLCFVYLGWGGGDGAGQLFRTERPRALVFTLLVLEVGVIGTFLALDLLLFFVFFEVVLIPMYFVIAVWGGRGHGDTGTSTGVGADGARRARSAAIKFILFTLLGSTVTLLGLLLVWARTGTLNMVELAARHGAGMPGSVQILAFVAIAAGLAVKTPMWPLHTWLPDAHTEAPTVGSVLLAGVLLKMGTYGFARIAIPVLPEGARALAPWLGVFAVVGIIYGALACLAQRDLKRMIAYSSIGHMGFVLLGFATLTPVGINAALFGNVAHGLITGLLFFVVGGIKERYGTADMTALGGGLLARLPHVGSMLTFAAIASLGLPGLAGFWGEMLALVGAFSPATRLSRPLYLMFMAIGGIGTVLTAAYFLIMLSRVTHGIAPTAESTTYDPRAANLPRSPHPATRTPEGLRRRRAEDFAGPGAVSEPGDPLKPKEPAGPVATTVTLADGGGRTAVGIPIWSADATPYELAAWAPLVALTVLLGLWPKALLIVTTPAVQAIVQGVTP